MKGFEPVAYLLDEHLTAKSDAFGPFWMRSKHLRTGHPVILLIRYTDDFVVMVYGQHSEADALRHEVGSVLSSLGLRLSEEKTRIVHMNEGLDFLGWRIQRHRWRVRCGKRATYSYPSKQSLLSLMEKVRSRPSRVEIVCYRYRGSRITTPWATQALARVCGELDAVRAARPVEGGPGKPSS